MNPVRGVGEGRGYICIPQSHTTCELSMFLCFNNSRILAKDFASKIYFNPLLASGGVLSKMVIMVLFCSFVYRYVFLCLYFIMLVLVCCLCSLSLPLIVVGWSVMCGGGISLSYKLVWYFNDDTDLKV